MKGQAPVSLLDVTQDEFTFATEFESFEKHLTGSDQAWLLPLRKAAMARFADLGFPTTRHEDWRFTNVARIAKTAFTLPGPDHHEPAAEEIKPFTFADDRCSLLVFINSRFSRSLSSLRDLPQGVKVGSLAQAAKLDSPIVEPHLARHVSFEEQAFTALNTAFMEDGAFIHIPKGTIVEAPIHVLHLSIPSQQAVISHPRNLIVAEIGSQATVVETYAGLGDGMYFTNAVTEIVVNENAVLDHYKIERESREAFHIATLQIHQYRSSNMSSHAISLGGALVRNEINAVLDGEGCDCTLNGLSMISGTQHVDNHLRVEHAKPHCNSRECFKNILDDKARAVFTGLILVRKDAQKTDAKQTNMNLILSDEAIAHSKPQLEILADDVRCTHGATIGQVDKDAIFYLRTRGISKEAARSLLVYAFASESIAQVRVPELRARLEQLLFARLPQGHLLRNVV